MTGRPPLYSDPLLMEAKIDQYFDECLAETRPPTIAGLCYFLGFCDKQALSEYEKREHFSLTVKKARLRIEMDRSERLLKSGAPTAGVIFDLTNNHGWKNPQHMKHSQDEDGEPQKIEVEHKATDALRQFLANAKPG